MTTERLRLERFLAEEVKLFYERTRHEALEEDALKSVCHLVLWVCALDEWHMKDSGPSYNAARDSDDHGRVIRGIRFARNRSVHQAVAILRTSGGAALPWVFPQPFFELCWRPAKDLPPGDPSYEKGNAKLEAVYIEHLEGKPVRSGIEAAREFLLRVPQPHVP